MIIEEEKTWSKVEKPLLLENAGSQDEELLETSSYTHAQ